MYSYKKLCVICVQRSQISKIDATLYCMQWIAKHVAFQTRHKDMQVLSLRSPEVYIYESARQKFVSKEIYRERHSRTRASLRISSVKGASSGRASLRTCARPSLSFSLFLSRSMRVSVLNVLLNLAISRIKQPLQWSLCISYFSDILANNHH